MVKQNLIYHTRNNVYGNMQFPHTLLERYLIACCWSIKHHLLQPDTGTELYKDK